MRIKLFLLIVFLITLPAFAAVNALVPDTLLKWMTSGPPFDFILIDLRNPATEQAAANVIGNDSCKPYVLVWPDTFKAHIGSIPLSMPLVVYCASGNRSGAASRWLDSAGYTNVYNAGGFAAWGTRPTLPVAQAKLKSLLPEPSMRVRSVAVFNAIKGPKNQSSRQVTSVLRVDHRFNYSKPAVGLDGARVDGAGIGVFIPLSRRWPDQ